MYLLVIISLVVAAVVVDSCPVVFVIEHVDTVGEIDVDYGSYFLRNGSQLDSNFQISKRLFDQVQTKFYCHVIEAIKVDVDATATSAEMVHWMRHECDRLLGGVGKCYYFADQISLKMVEEEEKVAKAGSIVPITSSPTMHPTVAKECSERTRQEDCQGECFWYWAGDRNKCSRDCTVLAVKPACLLRSQHCHWHGGKCFVRKARKWISSLADQGRN